MRRLTKGDVHLADDLAQDTFVRALKAAPGFRGEAQPRTWLARIALNVWHDHLRRARIRPVSLSFLTASCEDAGQADEYRAARPGDGAVDGAEAAQSSLADMVAIRLDIDRALARLPEAEREVVIHACWGDMSQAEIALATGLPLGTVKGLHRRAMSRMQDWLGGDR
jgi:RNA polymerase sigma-70 factor (ECF subfamily)